jgi:predicted O-methyltransferase YrrM
MTVPAAAERYLAQQFQRVRGASSKIATEVAVRLLAAQTAHNVRGHVAEIGVFEGRFFIALALCAAPGEKAIAIDIFTWPDEDIRDRFLANCQSCGVDSATLVTMKTSTLELSPAGFRKTVDGPIRFLHIDGAHTYDAVFNDLQLARAALLPRGVICLDDVLHPRYPALTVAVTDWLKAHPEYMIFAIVDRESFASACKFLLCRREHGAFYQNALCETLAAHVMPFRAPYFGTEALILSPSPIPPAPPP